MASATITLTGEGLEDLNGVELQISIEAIVNVDAKTARKQATAWLVSEVGNMLMAGPPRLVISRTTVWRLPALLTSSEQGIIGEVGTVDVDASTGQTLVNSQLRTQILDNVHHLVSSAPSSAG